MKLTPKLLATAFALALLASACGSADESVATEGSAGAGFVVQGEEALPDGVTAPTSEAPDESAGRAAEAATLEFDVTESTLPQDDEEDPDSEFFAALGDFQACLGTDGYRFIGLPTEGDPTEPVNDPGYVDALIECAALTQIVAKMEAAEDTSTLTAEEIESQNRDFTLFVDCMVGRGWTIPEPTPDQNGVLQPGYAELAETWIPPDGGSLLSDEDLNADDFLECGFDPDNPNQLSTADTGEES